MKILENPVPVHVSIGKQSPFPVRPTCMEPMFRPFKEYSFFTEAKSVWMEGDNPVYVSIRKDREQYVVKFDGNEVHSIWPLLDGLPAKNVKNIAKANREYGLEALLTDTLLLMNDFDVEIISTRFDENQPEYCDFVANLKWDLHGHVKPVEGIELEAVSDNGEFWII